MKFFLIFTLFVSAALAQGAKSGSITTPDRKIDAKELIAEMLDRPPREQTELLGMLKIRDAQGKRRNVPIRWITRPGNEDWNDTYQTPEGSEIPPEQLVIVHREAATNRYVYRRNGEVVAEASTNLFIPFGTSDFWLADLGLEFLRWPNPQHIKTEMRSSRACYVIETRNPNPSPNAYGRVLSFLDRHRT
jgi:hypothetical protein